MESSYVGLMLLLFGVASLFAAVLTVHCLAWHRSIDDPSRPGFEVPPELRADRLDTVGLSLQKLGAGTVAVTFGITTVSGSILAVIKHRFSTPQRGEMGAASLHTDEDEAAAMAQLWSTGFRAMPGPIALREVNIPGLTVDSEGFLLRTTSGDSFVSMAMLSGKHHKQFLWEADDAVQRLQLPHETAMVAVAAVFVLRLVEAVHMVHHDMHLRNFTHGDLFVDNVLFEAIPRFENMSVTMPEVAASLIDFDSATQRSCHCFFNCPSASLPCNDRHWTRPLPRKPTLWKVYCAHTHPCGHVTSLVRRWSSQQNWSHFASYLELPQELDLEARNLQMAVTAERAKDWTISDFDQKWARTLQLQGAQLAWLRRVRLQLEANAAVASRSVLG